MCSDSSYIDTLVYIVYLPQNILLNLGYCVRCRMENYLIPMFFYPRNNDILFKEKKNYRLFIKTVSIWTFSLDEKYVKLKLYV